MKVTVAGRGTEKSVVWCGGRGSRGGQAVEEIGGGVEALSPEASGKRGLYQKGVHDIVCGANHAFSLAVLRGGVGARHAQLDTTREEEGASGGVIKLTPIVTLHDLDGEAELGGHPCKEVAKSSECIGLGTQGKSPGVMGEVINHHQVVLVARHTKYRRCPQVAMDKIKDASRM